MRKRIKITKLVGLIILLALLLWNLRLMSDINNLSKENTAIKKSIEEERLRREGEDFSLHMRFDSLVYYIDKGDYAR